MCKHGVPDGNICDRCELGPLPTVERDWQVTYCNGRPYSQITDRKTGKLIAEAYQSLDNALFIAAAPGMHKALDAILRLQGDEIYRAQQIAEEALNAVCAKNL